MRKMACCHLTIFVTALIMLTACQADSWFRQANELRIDTRFATKIQYWPVPERMIPHAVELLKTQEYLAITPQDAEHMLGQIPEVPPSSLLFLIRAIDIEQNPVPLRVHFANGVVHVTAGTISATCYIFQPRIRKQPLVLTLKQPPKQVTMSYFCDGL